jgi:hypothetical protein
LNEPRIAIEEDDADVLLLQRFHHLYHL